MNAPTAYDPAREPFPREGIDDRVVRGEIERGGRQVSPRPRQRPARDERDDARLAPWPPRSKGPIPEIAADWNIATALDEMDAWGAEHDAAGTAIQQARPQVSRTKREYELEAAKARRVARSTPTERGRRTSADIDSEVIEKTHEPDGPYDRYLTAQDNLDAAMARLFAAKDNIERLRSHVSAAKILDPRG